MDPLGECCNASRESAVTISVQKRDGVHSAKCVPAVRFLGNVDWKSGAQGLCFNNGTLLLLQLKSRLTFVSGAVCGLLRFSS